MHWQRKTCLRKTQVFQILKKIYVTKKLLIFLSGINMGNMLILFNRYSALVSWVT